MNRKVFSGVLVGIGMLALSTTAAQASGGGSPSLLTSFFVCNSINGDDAGLRVDVDASTWNYNPKNVRIGNATLMCAFARLFPANSIHIPCPGQGCTELDPNPNADPAKQHLKCYAISVQKGTPGLPTTSYTVADNLLGTDNDVQGSSTQYICAPATLNPNP